MALLVIGLVGCGAHNGSSAPAPVLPLTNVSPTGGAQPQSIEAASFAKARGRVLSSDSDYGQYIDRSITGYDRAKILSLMKVMPPRWRGDLVYIRSDGTVLSNRAVVAQAVQFHTRPNEAQGLSEKRSAEYIPPFDDTTGPFIRQYSQTGVTAGYGYATVACNTSNIAYGDSGNLYMGIFDSFGDNIDAGLAYTGDYHITPYVNVEGTYSYSGWGNEFQVYNCGQHVALMFGLATINGSEEGVLVTGIPDEDPTVLALPPESVGLSEAAWDFFDVPLSFNQTSTWNGSPTPCGNCTAKRMTSIAFATGHNFSNDFSCFGACNGVTAISWDQVVMGQVIQPCSTQAGECTVEYLTDGSWHGGMQEMPTSGQAASFSPSVIDHNQFQEGINLGALYVQGEARVQSTGVWHSYATPVPLIIREFHRVSCDDPGTWHFYPGDTDLLGNVVPPGYEYVWIVTLPPHVHCPAEVKAGD